MAATRVETTLAGDIVSGALDLCAARTGLGNRAEVMAALSCGACDVCACLRDGLAEEVARYLGATDSSIRAVYRYDPEDATGAEDGIASPQIHLLVWARQKNAALSSLLECIKAALAQEREHLGCPKANALCCALDVQVVDDRQMQERSGAAVLLRSIHVRPTRIWQRNGPNA